MLRLFVLILSCATAAAITAATRVQGVLRHGKQKKAEGFIKALEFKHRLRVCNAFPHTAALDVQRGTSEKFTGESPMPYKTCKDFLSPLQSGDKLEFKLGDASAGTFSIAELPNNDAVLLLVIHRHDALSTAVSFESHVFASLLNAQVAVIDTYQGAAKATPRIMDSSGSKASRIEELRYDSVVAVNPGVYDIVLAGEDGKEICKNSLVAVIRESYVVLRLGVEAQKGPSYPQELLVYPQSDAAQLKSGSPRSSSAVTLVVALVTAVSAMLHSW